MKKADSYARICKYCGIFFRTPFKFGRVCDRCAVQNRNLFIGRMKQTCWKGGWISQKGLNRKARLK